MVVSLCASPPTTTTSGRLHAGMYPSVALSSAHPCRATDCQLSCTPPGKGKHSVYNNRK